MCDTPATIGLRPGRPRWGPLYASSLSQLTVLAMLEVVAPPNPVRAVARAVLTVGTFAAMLWWLRTNRAAFDLHQWCACAPATIVVRVIASHPRPPAPSIAPAIVLPVDADERLHVRRDDRRGSSASVEPRVQREDVDARGRPCRSAVEVAGGVHAPSSPCPGRTM